MRKHIVSPDSCQYTALLAMYSVAVTYTELCVHLFIFYNNFESNFHLYFKIRIWCSIAGVLNLV